MKLILSRAMTLLALIVVFSACEKEEEPMQTVNNDPVLPAAVSGEMVSMEVTFAETNAPYALNHVAVFSFKTSGALGLDLDPANSNGDEVAVESFTEQNGKYNWEDTSTGFRYALSLTAQDSINEVNVYNTNDDLLNQWSPL